MPERDEPYFDPIEEAEKKAKDPETAPQKSDDWPKIGGDKRPAEPDDD
jgi:hypothetical protein